MIFLLALFLSINSFGAQVRELQMKPTDVGVIHTAIGYSTVIQTPTKPLNVVLGDQASFRIEYINDSVTIKPLRPGKRSNLFIFTDKDRFNITLVSGPTPTVDYVVRIRRIFENPRATVIINKVSEKQGVVLTLLRSLRTDTSSFIDFQITNHSKVRKILKTEDFRFQMANVVVPIKGLFLESVTLEPNQTIDGSFSFKTPKNLFPCAIWIGFKSQKAIRFSFGVIRKGGAYALKGLD